MHGAAITLAEEFNKQERPDAILATDMLDLAAFKALSKTNDIPTAIYFHENQLNYPWSATDEDPKLKRDAHYAFINYTSALCADKVFFNSAYHQQAFLNALPKFLEKFPDYNNLHTVNAIAKKSEVLPLGLNLSAFDAFEQAAKEKPKRCVILWNHRWEYDKNPEAFFKALFEIADRGIDFNLVVLGEHFEKYPAIFDEARTKLDDKILHFGFAPTFEEYAKWLMMADLLPVTSVQDFFGGSVVEAMYCNAVPFLPKRLAYPEHIPHQFHSTFFYDESDFVNKLQRRIMDVKYLRVMNTRQYVEQYNWSSISGHYHKALQSLKLSDENH